MKIFVSYSRADGGEFAEKVYEYFKANSQDVFTDVKNIEGGDPWSKTIEENISTSEIFIVILTFAALRSTEVQREVFQAKKGGKKIIPAKYKNIRFEEVPWDLNANQGVEFETRDQLVIRLYEMIFHRMPPHPRSTSKKSLAVTMLLSGILTGLGHTYLGYKGRGTTILIVGFLLFFTSVFVIPFPYSLIPFIGYWAWQLYDAYTHFKRLKSDQTQT